MLRIFSKRLPGMITLCRSRYRFLWVAAVSLLVLSLAIGGAACYVVSELTHPGEQTAKIMLPDTDGYFTFNLKPGLSQSLKFKNFLDTFLENPSLNEGLQGLFDEIEAYWDIDVETEILPWLGPELAYGTFHGNNSYIDGPEMFVLLGTSDEAATRAILDKWLQKRVEVDGITVGNETYREVEITIVNPGDPTECYAVSQGYGLGFFGNLTRLHSTIDLMKDGGASLWDNANFQSARVNLPGERMGMGYFDAEHFLSAIVEPSLEDDVAWALYYAFRPYAPSFIGASFSCVDEGVKLDFYSPTPTGLDFAVQDPNPLRAASFVPGTSLAFVANQNPGIWWLEALSKRAELAQNPDLNAWLEQYFNPQAIEDDLGIDFEEDVFGWMSGEVALATLPYLGQGPGGGPALLGVFQFGNQTIVETSLDNIITGINNSGELELHVSYTTIEGVPATMLSWADYPGDDPITKLGYLFLDDFLVVGTSEDALAAVVQAYQDPSYSLAQSAEFQRMLSYLPQEKIGLDYLNAASATDFILYNIVTDPQDREFYYNKLAPFIEPLTSAGLCYYIGAEDSNVSFALHVERMPALVVEEKWEEWVVEEETYTVHYTVKNSGNAEAPAGHDVTLIVDGVEIEHEEVPVALAPGESYSESFLTVMTLSGEMDKVRVCADNFDEVAELDEYNNCRSNFWPWIPTEAGKEWLAAQQNPDGSWGTWNQIAKTGLAVLKFETSAVESGISPFDPEYPYSAQVVSGLDYLFANADTVDIGAQPAGDPDTDGDGIGVYFSGPEIYNAGIVAMAIAASTTPDRLVDVPGSAVDGWTYSQVLQDTVDYLAWSQTDYGYGRGGWNYEHMDNAGDRSDQSNSGYATLGLAYAEAEPPLGFGLSVPDFVRMELNVWIDYIQDDVDGDPEDGGAGYMGPYGPNILRTGNLLQQMAWVGDTAASPRVQDAIDYLVRHWEDPNDDPGWRGWPGGVASYQAMYTTMKGLESFGTDFNLIYGIDWFQDFVDALVAEQNPDGSWPACIWDYGEQILSTEWALLTLQKTIVPPPVLVVVEDATVTVGSSGSVNIWVRNFPEDGFGLGCYTIRIDYDPTMVQVTDVSAGDAPFSAPVYSIYADYVSIAQFSTEMPGPTGDIRIADLEFTCLAEGETTLALTIETLANTNGEEIAAAPVNGTITQLYLEAETSIADEQDFDDVVVVPATIVRVKDPVTGETVFGIPIGCYEARALYNPAGIEMLTVRPGDPPFDTPVFDINNPEGYTAFTQFTVAGSEPPIILARLVPRLIGCALDSYNLEVTFDLIADPEGGELPQQEPQFLTFQRGDISGDGVVNIIDAMFGAQYTVGLRPVEEIRPLNMASVHPNNGGDMKNIIDCMFIAQYVVGIRDCHFELVP